MTRAPVCPVCQKALGAITASSGAVGLDGDREATEATRAERANAPRPEAFPFCSRACRLVDLGRWLDGAYRVPGDPVSLDAEVES